MNTTQTYKICDNLIGLSELQNDSIDLTVTSPPYDNLRTYGGGYTFDFKKVASELFRVTKKGGVVVWVVGDATIKGSETGTSFRQALYFKEIGFNLHDTMIYQKTGTSSPSTIRYFPSFEYMFILTKGKLKTFNPLMDRKNIWGPRWGKTRNRRDVNGNLGKDYESKCPSEYGMRFNVWKYAQGSYANEPIAFKHPAIFPEQLAKDHILSWSNEGDTVLDPFLGSGTTLKMCMETNRNGIGFELKSCYEHIIKKSIE